MDCLTGIFVTLLTAAAPLSEAMSAYPARPIRFVVPYGAGGPSDVVARLYANLLTSHLGRPVAVENHPSAQGVLAVHQVPNAQADAYFED